MKMRTMTSERSQDGTELRLALHCLAEYILWCGRESSLDKILFINDLSIPAKLVGSQAVHACIHTAAACAENGEPPSPSLSPQSV